MSEQDCIDAFHVVRSLPGGEKAITEYSKTLTKEEIKMITLAINTAINVLVLPFDGVNWLFQKTADILSWLP